MKKLILILATILTVSTAAFFCACGGTDNGTTNPPPVSGGEDNTTALKNFTGLTFENKTVTYDGSEHAITVAGTLPDGANVEYSANKATNAGVYNASAVIYAEGYNPLTLTATLTINKAAFTGISLSDSTVTYDGSERTITVTGTLPEGTNVNYTDNKGTNAGVYNAAATVTNPNYETLTLNATLTINKATFTGITFTDATFIATGSEKTILISGELPEGSEVEYTNNSATEAGVYNATAVITNPNYETLTLNAVLTVNRISVVASEIINSLMEKPDPWRFMPEGLSRENMAYTSAPVSDFTSFVNTQQIGKKVIGKQLHVLYEGLIYASNLLGYIDNVYSVGATIAGLYQTYINANPDNYRQFTGEAGGFKIHITLDDDKYTLLAGNSTVSIELFYDNVSGARTGRIQLNDGMALKYETGDDMLKFAIKATIADVGNLKQIEFTENGGVVTGHMYEYTGTKEHALKTSAVIASDSEKTVIMSNKRETDDLKINGYEEVYNSLTGLYIGGDVQETVKSIEYDTLWFMLGDVSGLTSIKVTPEQNGLNADTIYINGASESISTKLVGGLSLRATSRRYDIEMKDVWYVVATTENGKTKYDTVKCSIPMLFVQKDQTDTFGKDIKDKNPDEFAAEPVLPPFTAVTEDYEALQSAFNTVKEQLSYDEINGYIGEENKFFEKQN